MGMLENLEGLLASGQDNALLRYSLGSAYFTQGDLDKAAMHLERAVLLDPQYSAAWKAYGKVLAAQEETDAAIRAYQAGIQVAEKRGDLQAAREMKVFLKRLMK